MSQALLISDNEVVNSLYEVNLKAYVAMNVSIKKNLSGAMELLGHAPNFDAIICFSETINNHKKGDHFISQIQDKLPHIPIIILGQFEGELKNGISIKNKYDIVTSVIHTPEDYKELTYSYLKECAVNNVIYVEAMISSTHAKQKGMSYHSFLEGVIKGAIKKAL